MHVRRFPAFVSQVRFIRLVPDVRHPAKSFHFMRSLDTEVLQVDGLIPAFDEKLIARFVARPKPWRPSPARWSARLED
jgi:hypothetical protein